MTTKNTATYLLTPPQRRAVIELARAYAAVMTCDNDEVWLDVLRRLLNAQDILGVELFERDKLLSYLKREAA